MSVLAVFNKRPGNIEALVASAHALEAEIDGVEDDLEDLRGENTYEDRRKEMLEARHEELTLELELVKGHLTIEDGKLGPAKPADLARIERETKLAETKLRLFTALRVDPVDEMEVTELRAQVEKLGNDEDGGEKT